MNRIKSGVLKDNLKKGKSFYVYSILFFALFFILVMAGGYFTSAERANIVDYRDIMDENKDGVVCYFEMFELTDLKVNMRKHYDKGFYAASDGVKSYLVYMNKKDAEKYMKMDLEHKTKKVNGVTGSITSYGKKYLIGNVKNMEPYSNNYFNATSTFGKKPSFCYSVAIAFLVISFLSFFVGCVGNIGVKVFLKKLNNEELEIVENELNNYDTAGYSLLGIYLTDKYIISLKGATYMYKIDEITEILLNGNNVKKSISIKTKDGKKILIMMSATQEKYDYFTRYITEKNNNVVVNNA